MKLCGFYDEDGDDVGLGRPQCAGNPYHCTYFRPHRYFCPFLKTSGGWDTQKLQEWKVLRNKWNAKRNFNRSLLGSFLRSGIFYWIILLLIGLCIITLFNWVKTVFL
jgi:hypothetical protein